MAVDCKLREATAADLPDLAALYEASGIDSPGRNQPDTLAASWERLQRLPGARVLMACDAAGLPLGTLTLFVLPLLAHDGTPAALVEDVAVHPQAQGRGIGQALMREAMRLAWEAGCYKLALSSNRKRESAHAFYRHLGFAQHGLSFVVEVPKEQCA